MTLEGKLHSTALPADLTSILDVGTGTGLWAKSMARAFPNAEIIATDLILPSEKDNMPTNMSIKQHNADDIEWSDFTPNQFDFIHARMITSGIHNWPSFRANCFRHLKPDGGLLEILDLSHPLRADNAEFDSPEASPLIEFVRLAGKSWRQNGLDYGVTEKQQIGLAEAGFKGIKEQVFRWPIGSWPEDEREKRMGELCQENVLRFLNLAGKTILINDGFMSHSQAEKVVQSAKEDLLKTLEKRFYYLM